MQEHFIPQDISNYRFHLIGELDLKQFLEIIVGVGIAFLISRFNWPGIIEWPLMIFFGGIGLIAAFIPIGDQPLSHWISVFFTNLFVPTKFFWHKEVTIPAYFLFQLKDEYAAQLNSLETFNRSPAKKHKVIDYFTTLDKTQEQTDKLEIFEQSKVNSVLSDFNASPTPKTVAQPKKIINKPSLQENQSVRVRPIIVPTQKNIDSFLNANSFFKPTQVTTKITSVEEPSKHQLNWPQANKVNNPTATPSPTTPSNTVSSAPPTSTITNPSKIESPIQKEPPKSIPLETPLSQVVFSPTTTASSPNSTPVPAQSVPSPNTTPASTISTPSVPVQKSPTSLSTDKSLVLQGRVENKDQSVVVEAILSLKDANGNLKFILRSDENGNFHSNQNLSPGKYVLTAQKDNLIFPEIFIDIDEQGIAPILLKPN